MTHAVPTRRSADLINGAVRVPKQLAANAMLADAVWGGAGGVSDLLKSFRGIRRETCGPGERVPLLPSAPAFRGEGDATLELALDDRNVDHTDRRGQADRKSTRLNSSH